MFRTIKWLSVVSTIGMFFILLGGALVTKTDSGAGCGSSWPLCNGQLFPNVITPELIIEYSHRHVSIIIGVTVLFLALFAWNHFGQIRAVHLVSFFIFLSVIRINWCCSCCLGAV